MTAQLPPVIYWFRRDLRLHDNIALNAALSTGHPVIPLFILDAKLLHSDMSAPARTAFLYASLRALDDALRQHHGQLLILQGEPLEVLRSLIDETHAKQLFFNDDYTPYAVKRDRATASLNIGIQSFTDALIVAPHEIRTGSDTPYTVYTPFKKKWREISQRRPLESSPLLHGEFFYRDDWHTHTLQALDELQTSLKNTVALPPSGEVAAQARLERFLAEQIYSYAESRNELTPHAFKDAGGTSQLSPYFRLGILSPRQAIAAARDAYQHAQTDKQRESVNSWVDELIWREFYIHIMANFPHVYSGNFRSEYDALAWRDAPHELTLWKEGETGYPIVDAAMRQLAASGWMPNRARMIVSSFLTKDLLINWREGERHFMQHLIDGDPAANNGGWQWAAGTGTDAQPYFRIFSPVSQSQRFDPNGVYLRTWLPEIAYLSDKEIHAPWAAKQRPNAYPPPIVDHAHAREQTLAAFKAVKNASTKAERN